MERRPRPAPAFGTFTVEAVSAFRDVAWHDDARLLAYFPSYQTNPYQALLYGAAREEGIAPVRMPRTSQLDELVALQASTAAVPTILHLHWLHPIQREATSDRDARNLGRAFLDAVDRYIEQGGRLAWTVHNVLPHETQYEDAEIALSAEIASRAHAIHVLTPGTAALVAPYYQLPSDRLFHVPHPSYRGAYPDYLSRADARAELGLGQHEFVVAAIGAIRPYKGLDELLEAWQQVPPDRPRRLLIAGAPSEQPGIEGLIERAALDPRVLIDARQIPADEIQLYLRSADVAVLPYRRALNSGALMLALTFGIPVIVPDGTGLAEAVEPSFARTYVAGDRDSLVTALTEAPDLATPEASAAALAAAARANPTELSRTFVRELRARLAATAS